MKVGETTAIGIVAVSDRASAGTCSDTSGPAIEEFLPDVLIDLANREKCALIFTTLHHAIDAGSHHRRVPAADVGIWRTDAYRKPETSADVDPVAADR